MINSQVNPKASISYFAILITSLEVCYFCTLQFEKCRLNWIWNAFPLFELSNSRSDIFFLVSFICNTFWFFELANFLFQLQSMGFGI